MSKLKEANDFLDECNALAATLRGADEATLKKVTLFKNWTIEDVIAHLYLWNHAAELTLNSKENFQAFMGDAVKLLLSGKSHQEMQRQWLDEHREGMRGLTLLETWQDQFPKVADDYRKADPELRVVWAGPDMSARSCIIARQMETWAHGQEVFDSLGLEREEKDRILNICHLGVTTYSWSFRNRGEEPPLPKPYVKLTAPSGAVWEWNEPQDDNAVTGPAVAFAQVVAQTRNIADTPIEMTGAAAARWMEIAQCFAGTPETPPAKGARHKA